MYTYSFTPCCPHTVTDEHPDSCCALSQESCADRGICVAVRPLFLRVPKAVCWSCLLFAKEHKQLLQEGQLAWWWTAHQPMGLGTPAVCTLSLRKSQLYIFLEDELHTAGTAISTLVLCLLLLPLPFFISVEALHNFFPKAHYHIHKLIHLHKCC